MTYDLTFENLLFDENELLIKDSNNSALIRELGKCLNIDEGQCMNSDVETCVSRRCNVRFAKYWMEKFKKF